MRRAHSWLAVLAGVLVAGSPWLAARTVHINHETGDDARDGVSPEASVRTLSRGLALCEAGDTLSLAPGTGPYYENLIFGSRGGRPGRPIVVEGNGAVLSGLQPLTAEAWQDRGDGLWFYPTSFQRGSLRPFLVRPDGTPVPRAARSDAVAVGTAHWDSQGILWRGQPGEHPGELGLRGTLRDAGVAINGASHITIRNLTCEHFANDGFNIHGHSQGLFFEAIVGRYNGDDGFSIHEDVGAAVHGGWFHNNTFGIQDVNHSRSTYVGVRVEANQAHGVHFSGGAHSLSDALIRDNGLDQLRVDPDRATHLGATPEHPFAAGTTYVRNTVILGGRSGVTVSNGSQVALRHCFIGGAEVGALAEAGAALHLYGTVLADCRQLELHCASPLGRFDANAYWPGRVRWLETTFTPEQFAAYQEASGQDRSSVVAAPVSLGRGFRLAAPTIPWQNRLAAPGPQSELDLPFGEPVWRTADPAAPDTSQAGVLRFDFESVNPWSRVYPVPEKAPDGQPLAATATLSDEQAVSGRQAVKLEVALPPGGPANWLIKLFSVHLDACSRPVRTMRFQLYGDGSGTRVALRLRDADGESFNGPALSLDWEGWRQVAWDLAETPPRVPPTARGNGRQDVPPLEVILDIHPAAGAAGGRFVLYADDLELVLEEP